jgi:hypothetical protein
MDTSGWMVWPLRRPRHVVHPQVPILRTTDGGFRRGRVRGPVLRSSIAAVPPVRDRSAQRSAPGRARSDIAAAQVIVQPSSTTARASISRWRGVRATWAFDVTVSGRAGPSAAPPHVRRSSPDEAGLPGAPGHRRQGLRVRRPARRDPGTSWLVSSSLDHPDQGCRRSPWRGPSPREGPVDDRPPTLQR